MPSDLDRDAGRAEGRRRAQRTLSGLEARREAVLIAGRRALLEALLLNGTATADDVRDALELPADVNPVCLGAVPGPLAKAGIIVEDGYATTSRPRAHARPLKVWRLVDRDAALRWLAEHASVPIEAIPAGEQRLLFEPGGNSGNKKPNGGNRWGGGR